MKPFKLVLFFPLLLITFLLATIPASFLLKQIQVDNTIQYGAITGPWWASNADWVGYKGFIQENIQITLNFACLLKASICLNLDNDKGHIQLDKSLLSDAITVEKSHFKVELNAIQPLLNGLIVKPSGAIEIKLESFILEQQQLVALSADIFWYDVGVEGEAFNLGTVQIKVGHQPGKITLKMLDQSNKLDLRGETNILSNGFINSNIQLTTLDNFPSSVKSLIENVMIKRGNNSFMYKRRAFEAKIKGVKF